MTMNYEKHSVGIKLKLSEIQIAIMIINWFTNILRYT